MRQVFKEGSTTIQVECWDAIQAVIYRKKDPHGRGNRKTRREREREKENCETEKCVS